MAYNEVIDGNLKVLGQLSATGTASFSTSSAVFFTATSFTLTASSTSNAQLSAATLNTRAGKITTTALTSLALSTFSLVVTNSAVSSTDLVLWNVANGTNTGTGISVGNTLVSNGAMTLVVNTVSALNGTLVLGFSVFK